MKTAEDINTCKDVFAALSEYLDLELPPDACEKIEQHLATCSPCIDFVDSLRKTVEMCRRFQPSQLPEPIGKQAREQLMAAYRKTLANNSEPRPSESGF